MAIDWDHEVYNSGDNIPGDPEQVAALGRDYRDTADAIRKQAAAIRNLVNGQGWDSDSGREFQKTSGETADKLEKAHSRYDAAANALGTGVAYPPSTATWAMSLAYAQQLAKDAIRRGQEAQANSRTAQHQIDQHNQQQADLPPPPPGAPPAGPDHVLGKLNDTKSGYDADLAQAEKDLQHARDVRDQQANKFADAIVGAYNNDGLKDGFWTKVGAAVEDIAQVVGHWAAWPPPSSASWRWP
ncbi:putative T7SS-secreted protein [Catenulispora yoronensis]